MSRRFATFHLAASFVCAVFAGVAAGCGGGTTGTGDFGSDTRIAGLVVDSQGAPLEGTTVIVSDTGDETITDPSGSFVFETSLPDLEPELIIQRGEISQKISLGSVTERDSTIEVTIQIDEVRGEVGIASIVVTARTPVPAPQEPTPTPSKAGTPRPAATVTPIAESVFRGSVIDAFNGSALAGAVLRISPQGLRGTTKKDGSFQIEGASVGGRTTIAVDYQSRRGSVTLTLPKNRALDVQLVLTVDTIPSTSTGGPTRLVVKAEKVRVR